jgi:NAD(P)-dependent dehydrogenase (short-subunit alcohol dehydrogenase family)
MTAKGDSLVALITGGTEGLGKAMALRLAREGYRVFAAGRSAERRARLGEEARALGLPVTPLEMDVCNEQSVDRGLAEIRTAAGPVDVLINNAGIAYVVIMEEIRIEHLRQQFETNVFAAVRLIQRVLPEMRARRRGWIVNMSSVAGRMTIPTFGPYSGSKHALEAISDALRLELHSTGVRVIVIEPSYIKTNMEGEAGNLSAEYRPLAESGPYAAVYRGFRKGWQEKTSAARTTPEDCAEIVLRALQSEDPEARYTVPPKAKRELWLARVLPERFVMRRILRDFGPQATGSAKSPAAKPR